MDDKTTQEEGEDDVGAWYYIPDRRPSLGSALGAWFPLMSPTRLLALADELHPIAFAAFVVGESILLGVVVGLGASVIHRVYHVLGWAT